MAIDPAMMGGSAPGAALGATQLNMPPQAAPPGDPGAPVDPAAAMAAMQMAPPQAPPPKPPSLLPTEVGKLLAEAINNTKIQAAHGLTEYMGAARGTVNAKYRDLLKVWRKKNPNVDPLFEKIVNKKSDEEIMESLYPTRRALIRYQRRTYTEQVQFAEFMDKLDKDPRYADLDTEEDFEEDEYIPPQAQFPTRGEERFREDIERDREEEEDERTPEERDE